MRTSAILLMLALACGGSDIDPSLDAATIDDAAIADDATIPGGPPPCGSEVECDAICPPELAGCSCVPGPEGNVCIPSCTSDGDCPPAPGGTQLVCRMSVCVPS